MRKIITVIGARPQFIKAAVMSKVLNRRYDEIIIHTGQHFDSNMSDVFFRELGIPAPKYNLGISGGSHGAMTGAMLAGIEKILQEEKPDAVLLYGDTNSTLAGVLAAVKLHIPVFHVEAGNRLGTLDNPEEVNRIAADRFAALRFCASESAMEFLSQENLSRDSYLVGSVMYDAFIHFGTQCPSKPVLTSYETGLPVQIAPTYCYMTCHRAENTGSDKPITEILKAVNSLGYQVIYPVHPRIREQVRRILRNNDFSNIAAVEPVGYLESLALTRGASRIVTDSGGCSAKRFMQAFHASPCSTTSSGRRLWSATAIRCPTPTPRKSWRSFPCSRSSIRPIFRLVTAMPARR